MLAKAQAIFPGGDGWVYSFEPNTGKLIWKFDCNPKDSKWELGGFGTRNNLISTPVIHEDKVYIGVGQDPEHGTGIGHFYAIDATKTGDITESGKIWHFGNKDFGRTMSTPAIADGLLYICDLEGFLYCLELKTGKQIWKHDLFAALWGSPMLVDGKIYIGDEDGDITVLKHGRELKVLNEINMEGTVYTTPSPANGRTLCGHQIHVIRYHRPMMLQDQSPEEVKTTLDAWTREVVAWHFSEETGCPFWLDYQAKLGWDPIKEIGCFDDLKQIPLIRG